MSTAGRKIDWEEVKKRLHASQAALEKAGSADPERLENVFRERAAQLAARGAEADRPANVRRILVFTLGAERYALEFADLVELLPFTGCTPVPAAPQALLGVTNVHGDIRSVLDLGQLLDLPVSEAGPAGYLLLVRKQSREVALRVDQLERVCLVSPEQVSVLGDSETDSSLHYIKGLAPDKIRLLNTEALLKHPIFRGAGDNRGKEGEP